jgi:hypothetical protein
MEVTDQGSLRRRLPVTMGPDADVPAIGKFIGYLEKWMVWSDGPTGIGAAKNVDRLRFTYHSGLTSIDQDVIWNVVDVYAGIGDAAIEHHQVVHFFRFNGRNYFLSIGDNIDGTIEYNKFYLHNFTAGTPSDVTVTPSVFASINPQVTTKLFQIDVDTHGMDGVQPFDFLKAFWFRQRYWIVTTRGIYYSKSLDPTNFASPDGGFFLYPDDLIKDVVALHDKIYVLGQDNLEYITYNNDPADATDVQQVQISMGVGGDALCVYQDDVYMARVDQLYLVETSRVTKVLDLDLGYGPAGPDVQLTAFGDYIIACFRASPSSGFITAPTYENPWYPSLAGSGYVDQTSDDYHVSFYSNTFFINMKNSSCFEFQYTHYQNTASFDPDEPNSIPMPSDWYFHPYEGDSGQYYVWFTLNTVDNSITTTPTRIYSMRLTDKDVKYTDTGFDFAWKGGANGNTPWWQPIPTLIEIEAYSPDDSELQVKKFRNLLLEGEFPAAQINPVAGTFNPNLPQLFVAYDNEQYLKDANGQGILLTSGDNAMNSSRLPEPTRIPLNQRARAISFKFLERGIVDLDESTTQPGGANTAQRYQIVNLGLTWTPTKRAPIHSTSNVGGKL